MYGNITTELTLYSRGSNDFGQNGAVSRRTPATSSVAASSSRSVSRFFVVRHARSLTDEGPDCPSERATRCALAINPSGSLESV